MKKVILLIPTQSGYTYHLVRTTRQPSSRNDVFLAWLRQHNQRLKDKEEK